MELTAAGCSARRRHLIDAAKTDYVIITNPRHIFYFTGVHVTPLTFGGWGVYFLVIDASSGKSHLIVDNFLGGAKRAHVDQVDVWTWYDTAQNSGVAVFPAAIAELKKRYPSFAGKRIGIELGSFPLGAELGGETVDITPLLIDMRRVKYDDELVLIHKALEVTGIGHLIGRTVARAGLNELDVYNAIYTAMVNAASGPVNLLGDVISGERCIGISGPPTRRELRDGDTLILDLAPIVNGYRGDNTSTVVIGGNLTDELKAIEGMLHEAMHAVEAVLKPGTRCADVYQAAAQALEKHGEKLVHHAGHGLGLYHPEAPYFVPNSTETLRAGEVVTVEPGVYKATFGARIEHNYLITETGFERLTHHKTTFV
ncbi:MAG: aminopeptidase P family protein [Anaerolineae bacterium]|nr:aminopeptidase P family protein [Anaerolineae bacterium]